ncbi:MAG: hypothetical protein QNJ05_05485 [Woeseiaceae bacterium]|nr:hypothetical protein [Woeseiaceae bacterium]
MAGLAQKQKSIPIAALIAAFGATLWLVFNSDDLEDENSRSTDVAITATEVSDASSTASVDIKPDAKSNRSSDSEPEDQASNEETKGDFEEGELVAEWGDFVPMRVVNENCRDTQVPVLRQGGIEYIETVECERNRYIDHAYAELPTNALRELAEYDGAAAFILAQRLSDDFGGRHEIVQRLYVHAFVLSGEQQAFDALYDYQNGALVRTNGELDLDRAINGWIWSRIGEELGYKTQDDVEAFESALAELNIESEYPEQEVREWIEELNARRMAALGESFQ